MSSLHVVFRTLFHYVRTNLVLALGVAAATAVLTGALIVGDSMRSSLRTLALDRLGRIDEIIVSDGFFRAALADEIRDQQEFKAEYELAVAGILFPNGSVELGDGVADDSFELKRVSNVNVFGIPSEFWALGDPSVKPSNELTDRQVVVNETLGRQLGWAANLPSEPENLTLRIPKPTQLPADSSLGKKSDLVESLVELEVQGIVPDESIGRFGLHPSQVTSPNIFVPLELLQSALARGALKHKTEPQANVIFLSAREGSAANVTERAERLRDSIQPTLADLGLNLKLVAQQSAESDENIFEYYSLSSDRLVLSDPIAAAIRTEIPQAAEVLTYLANDIRQRSSVDGIPFSMISAIDVGTKLPLVDVDGNLIDPLSDFEIVLNEWAADDLQLKVGDQVELTYFEPESTHGAGEEQTAVFKLKAIAKLTPPDRPFRLRRRKVIPAEFLENSPTLANDPDLTPEVPGLTDAESIENWDLPFSTADKLRAADDDYWNEYRTTPKGFIALKRGQKLWGSRFGRTTSFRIPKEMGKIESVRQQIRKCLLADPTSLGFQIIPIKQNAIEASSGSTPFDGLFLALSMFVIASALILVSLLFRLTLKRRAAQIGTLMAVGWTRAGVGRVLLLEMLWVAAFGSVMGVAIGVGYAALMIYGLKTWWLGAISQPILNLHLSPVVLAGGALSGLVICVITIAWTIRATAKNSIRGLLGGELGQHQPITRGSHRWSRRIIAGLVLLAVVLSVVAVFLGGEPQAGAFMGAGFMVLLALLWSTYLWLGRSAKRERQSLSLGGLAQMAGQRNPLRSTLTIGLVAVASFLIVAVSSFRLTPTREGTGDFDLLATSDQPIFDRFQESEDLDVESYSLRVKAGEDASCTNLYQSSQPQVLGVSAAFIESFRTREQGFRWASIDAKFGSQREHPWGLLQQKFSDGAIPVVIDKNTANYSLKIFATGGDYEVDFDSGQKVVFRVVGFLENSILQGSLLISEENFIATFPDIAGYRMFLFRALDRDASDDTEDGREAVVSALSSKLEERYSDQGFDARSAAALLAGYQQVQNTYISTFQTLGALGLLLGTFGLASIQIRSVLERQKELGLMRAVGFSRGQLSRMVLLENAWLLAAGLAIGVGSALVTTLPHYLFGGASIPWVDLAVLFTLILLFGLAAAALASRILARMPLVASLRA